MKNLKYILFSFLICFIYINNVNADATCVYNSPVTENNKYTITCKASNFSVSCSVEDSNNTVSMLPSASLLKVSDFKSISFDKFICPNTIYSMSSENVIYIISPLTGTNSHSLNKSKSSDDSASATTPNQNTNTNPNTNPTTPNNSATVCVYDSPANYPYKYTITCKPNSSGNAACDIQDSYNQLSIANGAESFQIGDTCPSTIYISAANNEINSINTSSGDALSLNKNKSTESNSGFGGNTTTPTTPNTPSTPNDKDIDLEHFCQGSVQGVFTTLGWVFFIVKILVPILLIVFGSIDVAKAVITSKDDELKKSVKTLALRTIAGVIIFFVPTVLNFVVNIIDDNEVYKGTFWDCTKCMLDPNGNVCSSLKGE